MLLIAAFSAIVVALSLEESLVTASALLGIAFFLAVAFFLFLLWRERRSDIEAWSEHSRRVFYGAILLAVVAIGAFIGLGANGRESVAFVVVVAVCVYALVRVWRREHTYS
jgi:4-amino-4-deoxy-L-arabinose transferase-like glycosyltransferase